MAQETKDPWEKWWPRLLSLSGLVIVFFIVVRGSKLDPYFYPILALMLGFPIVGLFDSVVRRKNGNGSSNSDKA